MVQYRGIQAVPQMAIIHFVADAGGVFESVTIEQKGRYFAEASIVFGTTPPDALGITVNDADGIDLLSGAGASVTATKRITNSPPRIFYGDLIVVPTGNTTAGAIITVKLYFI